jgi:hypothetical protein
MLELARDPKHPGADIGFLGVFHTWGQNLRHHPHVHYIVPAEGLAPDGPRCIESSCRFFLPVKALGQCFRRNSGPGFVNSSSRTGFSNLLQPAASTTSTANSAKKDWVVYAKPPFDGAEYVFNYLARCTHRVAISNHRLVVFENDRVSFRWRDYAHGGKTKVKTLSADEFLRNFLIHVLPKGLVRIRHFGLFANRRQSDMLTRCLELFGAAPAQINPIQRTSCVVPPAPAPWSSSNG